MLPGRLVPLPGDGVRERRRTVSLPARHTAPKRVGRALLCRRDLTRHTVPAQHGHSAQGHQGTQFFFFDRAAAHRRAKESE